MTKSFLLFVLILIFSENSLGSQGMKRTGSEWLLPQGTRSIFQHFHLSKRAFPHTLLKDQTLVSTSSRNMAHAVERLTESSVLSQAPRILTCHKVRDSAFEKWRPTVERVTIPSYAHELSQWVLNRRLGQLPTGVDQNAFKKNLKEHFNYQNVWLSVTSNAVLDLENYQLVVNHTDVDTSGCYYSGFDVFLKDAPHKLWIEGKMRISDIRFEGSSIRDAYGLNYSFQVLVDQVFPDGLLDAHFSGEELTNADKASEMKKLVEDVLDEDTLNHRLLWKIHLIPFINSLPKDLQPKD